MTNRPWLNAYPEGVPADIDTSGYRSLVELMQESFQRYGDRAAYSFLGQRLSFAELDQRSHRDTTLRYTALVPGDNPARKPAIMSVNVSICAPSPCRQAACRPAP